MSKTVDQIYVDNLYAEISRLTRRAVEVETLLEFEREQRQRERDQEAQTSAGAPDLPEDVGEQEVQHEPEEA